MYAQLTLPAGQQLPDLPRTRTVRVRSAHDLRDALRQARGQALTLDGSGMDRVLRVDTALGLLEVQAATSWSALARQLAGHHTDIGAFARQAGLPATVGECVSLACPGPDGLPVTAHVESLTLVTPDGEMRRTGRDQHPELLRLVLGGQGVIGVLYSVTLSIDSLRRSAAAALAPAELRLDDGAPAAGADCTLACLLPPESLDAWLADMRAIAAERRLALLGISVRRTLPDASCALNWARREWAHAEVRFQAKPTLGASVGAAEARRALVAAALAHGGAMPIHDLRDATRAQLDTCYPALAAFIAEKRRIDPAERLQNAWYRRAAAALRPAACEVRWARDPEAKQAY